MYQLRKNLSSNVWSWNDRDAISRNKRTLGFTSRSANFKGLKMKLLDHATKIDYLSRVIKTICEENNLKKEVVIEDFIDLMNEKDCEDEEWI